MSAHVRKTCGWPFFLSCVRGPLVNCPTQQSLLLLIGSLHWLSSWRWWPPLRGVNCIGRSGGQKWVIWAIFLQISQITCVQMENFVVAILYLVYFALKYMYFEDLWVKSCEFPKMRTTLLYSPHFRKFVNMVRTLCAEREDGSSRISENEDYKHFA